MKDDNRTTSYKEFELLTNWISGNSKENSYLSNAF